MKKSFIYGTMALIGAGFLTACSDEPAAGISGEGHYGSAVGSQGTFGYESRTSAAEDENYNLTRLWENNEKVIIFDNSSKKNYGVIAHTGTNENIFTGNLFYTAGANTNLPVTVAYLGKETRDAQNVTRSISAENYPIDLTSQKGTIAGLVDYDVQLHKNASLNIDADCNWSLNFNVQSVLSFVHFTIKMPKGEHFFNNTEIKVSGLNTKGNLDLVTGAFTEVSQEPITITVPANQIADDKVEVYLSLIPDQHGQKQKAKFEFVIGTDAYEYEDIEWNYEGNRYYNNGYNGGSSIPVINTKKRVVKYYSWVNGTYTFLRDDSFYLEEDGTVTIGNYQYTYPDDNVSAYGATHLYYKGENGPDTSKDVTNKKVTVPENSAIEVVVYSEYWLQYNLDGGTLSGVTNPTKESWYNVGEKPFTISSTKPVKIGYIFKGYRVGDENGAFENGTLYQPGETVNVRSYTHLYAIWEQQEKVKVHYWIRYYDEYNTSPGWGNADYKGDKSSPITIGDYTGLNGNIHEYLANPYSVTWKEGTNSGASENGVVHNINDIVIVPAGTTDFHVWAQVSLTVNFHKGCADTENVTNLPSTKHINEIHTAITVTETPARAGYVFKGWAYTQNATTADVQPGGRIRISSLTSGSDGVYTVYAVWEDAMSRVGVNAGNLPASNPWSNN